MFSRLTIAVWLSNAALLATSCSGADEPTTIRLGDPAFQLNHNSAAHAEKGYIAGWFNGADVSLRYTRLYFCAEPPSSGADSHCEIGAPAEVAPRPGRMPNIYAIAAVGFVPDVLTLSCPPNSTCLNHPAMIDASRVAGPAATNIRGIPHSHIIEDHRAGWHQTVNIRVFNLAVWNEIVAAKSIDRVRELQADPAVGGAGLISPDTPTNIFFFLEVQPARSR